MDGQPGHLCLKGPLEFDVSGMACLRVHGERGPNREFSEQIKILRGVLLAVLVHGKNKGNVNMIGFLPQEVMGRSSICSLIFTAKPQWPRYQMAASLPRAAWEAIRSTAMLETSTGAARIKELHTRSIVTSVFLQGPILPQRFYWAADGAIMAAAVPAISSSRRGSRQCGQSKTLQVPPDTLQGTGARGWPRQTSGPRTRISRTSIT